MNVDKEWLPRWGWLLAGLFGTAMVANLANALVLGPLLGLPVEYFVVTIIAAMAPVLVYVGVWLDEERQHYWERSTGLIVGDLAFIVVGTVLGAAFVIAIFLNVGIPQIARELVAMIVGFLFGWVLFYWRNPDVYQLGPE